MEAHELDPSLFAPLVAETYQKKGLEEAMRYCFSLIEKSFHISGVRLSLLLPEAKTIIHVARVDSKGVSQDAVQFPEEVPTVDPLAVYTEENIGIQLLAWSPTARDVDAHGITKDVASIATLEVFRMPRKRMLFVMRSPEPNNFNNENTRILIKLFEPLIIELRASFDLEYLTAPSKLWGESSSPIQRLAMCQGLGEVVATVRDIADTGCTVLVTGETGTGKEVVADAIHELSLRKNAAFVKVNCASIPETLIESELFGTDRGAFTGAISRAGFFEQANGGTIFLDEVGELSPSAQARLLRVLDRQEIQRVGGTRNISLNVRILAATHRDLGRMVRSGEFRADLWYRLNNVLIVIPPLRARKIDISILTKTFVKELSAKYKCIHKPVIDEASMGELLAYSWPGNVRELQHVLERAVLQTRRGQAKKVLKIVLPQDNDAESGPRNPGSLLSSWPTLEEWDAAYIQSVLEKCAGRIKGPGGAAEILGLPPSTLRSRLKRLGLNSDAHT